MEIEKPIFILGSGRSGTTILYSLLSIHPEVCWFSNLTNRFSSFHALAAVHRILDIPFVGKHLKQNLITSSRSRLRIRPTEADYIYHDYCKFEHARKTTEKEMKEESKLRFLRIIESHLKYTNKRRFINKQTSNTQRIRIINEIFPDAFFLHIIRDGRAAANSMYHGKHWPIMDIWWLGMTGEEWVQKGNHPIELCALQWERNIEEIHQNLMLFKDRYMELKYEDFAKDVKAMIKGIVEFCELEYSEEYDNLLPDTLKNMNFKWEEMLSKTEKALLLSCIGGSLSRLGYSPQIHQGVAGVSD